MEMEFDTWYEWRLREFVKGHGFESNEGWTTTFSVDGVMQEAGHV